MIILEWVRQKINAYWDDLVCGFYVIHLFWIYVIFQYNVKINFRYILLNINILIDKN